MSTMTLAAFARRHGVSPPAVQKWKRNGLLVLAGAQVDVEASDARLARYRNEHDGRAARGPKKDRFNAAPAGRVQLSDAEILRRLRALDWARTFDWSEAAQAERAQLAARCVGWEAAQSDRRDDGHWGEFQLRDPRWVRGGQVRPDAVVAGFGFEATASDVLDVCRREVTPDDDDEKFVCSVDLALLPLLAFPHFEGQRP